MYLHFLMFSYSVSIYLSICTCISSFIFIFIYLRTNRLTTTPISSKNKPHVLPKVVLHESAVLNGAVYLTAL